MNLKTYHKILKISFLASSVLSLLFLPFLEARAATPHFNDAPADSATLRLKNSTRGDDYWRSAVEGYDNDRISFDVYYHNDEEGTTAYNVRLRLEFPSSEQSQIQVSAKILSDNAPTAYGTVRVDVKPTTSYGQLIFENQAKWYPNRQTSYSYKTIYQGSGYVEINIGDIQGCFEYQGHAVFEARLETEQYNDYSSYFTLQKQVYNLTNPNGTPDYNNASEGERLRYLLKYTNTENKNLPDFEIIDVLPSYTKFISASANGYYNTAANKITWNLGDLGGYTSGSVYYEAEITNLPYGTTQIKNSFLAQSQSYSKNSNEVLTTLYKVKPTPPPAPPIPPTPPVVPPTPPPYVPPTGPEKAVFYNGLMAFLISVGLILVLGLAKEKLSWSGLRLKCYHLTESSKRLK